jgi:hypothetical protein
MTSQPPFFRNANSKRRQQAIAILLATLLLHLIFVAWGRKHIGMQPAVPDQAVVEVALLNPPAPPVPPAPKPQPKPKPVLHKPAPKPVPKFRPRPHPEQQAPPPPPIATDDPGNAPADQSDTNVAANTDAAVAGDTVGDKAGAGIAGDPTPPLPPSSQTPPHHTDAPPSVALKYDVQGLRDGQKVYGSGKITWRNMGDRYRIDGSASVLFFTLLQFSSDGMLDDFGVSPTLYTEQRFHKTATDTRFEHARNTITFSSSDQQYPRPGDAQDRASIIWQLAAMGRSDPAVFSAGAGFDIFVAGVRDAEPWQVTVSGEENLDMNIDGAPVSAWHLVRLPRPGSYDQKIDIWLAPRQQWYPVKIRYTESDGDFLEMSLSDQTPL